MLKADDPQDPAQRRSEKKLAVRPRAETTFEGIARAWWEQWQGNRSARHAGYVLRRLEADVFPEIGASPIASITAKQLLAVSKKIEERGAVDIAKRAFQTSGQVMRYAVANGVIECDPSKDVKPGDGLKPRRKENSPA